MNAAEIARKLLLLGAAAGLGGLTVAVWSYIKEPGVFFGAWLAAFYFWLSMPLGALALLLIWDLTGGSWGSISWRPLTAMAATMPLFVLLFLPIIAGRSELYPWLRPEVAARLHNGWYLNLGFFLLRAAIFFAIWNLGVAWRLLRPAEGRAPQPQWISALGLMLLVYTVTFAGIDWMMSTEPDWFSSIYGMIVGAGTVITSASFTLLFLALTEPSLKARHGASAGALASFATLLLAVVIFWAYTSFCQWLIVWEENLRADIPWYLSRRAAGWGATLYALAAAHFLIPFLLLVWTPAKRNVVVVGWACALLIVAGVVQVWWLLVPGLRGSGFSWVHPAILIGMGGIWLMCLALTLRRSDSARPFRQGRRSEGLLHG